MIKTNPTDFYLTSKEAASRLGVTQDYVRYLILNGKIKAAKLGHMWLIKPKDLKWVARQRFSKKKDDKNGSSE